MSTFFRFFLVFLILLTFVFRSLIFNISTNLIDWLDYPLILWIMYQTIDKISGLNFLGFFNTNAFYPHPNTLFFSDLLIPQAIMAFPFFSVSKNLILSFNLVFLSTFILNYIGSYLLWRKIFNNNLIAFIGSLFLVFSPFFHLEISHFQMLSFWPFVFCLYFILKGKRNKNFIVAGIFLSLQFLTSVYLSSFLVVTILVYYLVQYLVYRNLRENLISLSLIFATFIILSGVFIKGYIDTQKMYHVTRDIREYIQYSAHLSDYFFTNSIRSFIHKSPPLNIWNGFNQHTLGVLSAFPGFLLFSLSLIGLVSVILKKKELSFILNFDRDKAFFALLLILGFIFSLGPRLNFNGAYAYIPLPFLFYKVIPFLEVTRAPARWSFILYMAIIYFALLGIIKLKQKINPKIVISVVLIFFFLEYIPLNLQTNAQTFTDTTDPLLKEICKKDKKVLLEIPVTHLDAAPSIIEGLNYITKTELASTYHNCYLVNGYSGYDLPELLNFRDQLTETIKNKKTDAFLSYLKENNVNLVQFNTSLLPDGLKEPASYIIENLKTDDRVTLLDNATFEIK